MIDTAGFLRALLETVSDDPWSETSTGYQLVTRDYLIQLDGEQGRDLVRLAVERDDGEPLVTIEQSLLRQTTEELTRDLSTLLSAVAAKQDHAVPELGDVIRQIRDARSS